MNEMSKQMDMFQDGGLMDEGGTVDPVSGNDVPPGSNQEEVRDDIPAQLSEGEFVFPADVVRYFGLEKLMEMRQEAKMGLQRMEDMGQMGNSEEAIMPDNLPFDIDDIDMEDNGEPQEFNLGGVVQAPGTGIAGYTPPPMPTTGYTPPPVGVAAAPVVPGSQPQVAFTPATSTTNIPTFGQFVGTGAGKYDELVTYVNDAGQTMQIPHVNGKPIYPVPEGFKKQDTSAGIAPDSTIVDTTKVKTATVQDEGDDTFEQDQEDMQRDQARVDAAKALGYTNFAGFTQGLAAALGYTTLPAGTVTGIGYIADGLGNIVDPTTGLVVPQGLLDSVKHSANIVVDTFKGQGDKGLLTTDGNRVNPSFFTNPNVYDKNMSTRNIIARGFGVIDPKTGKVNKEVQKIRTKMAKVKVKDAFKNIRDDIKDGKYTSDFATSKEFEDYIDDVEKSIAKEVARGNVDFQTGQVINPFEASGGANRGDGQFDEPASAPSGPPSSAADYGALSPEDLGSMVSESQDSGSYDGQGDNVGESTDPAGSAPDDEAFSLAKGGLAKQMKRSGLASKK